MLSMDLVSSLSLIKDFVCFYEDLFSPSLYGNLFVAWRRNKRQAALL